MKVKMMNDGLLVEPETDFEADYLRHNFADSGVRAFLKHGMTASELVGLKIYVPGGPSANGQAPNRPVAPPQTARPAPATSSTAMRNELISRESMAKAAAPQAHAPSSKNPGPGMQQILKRSFAEPCGSKNPGPGTQQVFKRRDGTEINHGRRRKLT